MLKVNRFAKHLLSFFAVLFVRLDAADALPTTLYEPKDGAYAGCNTLVGGCAPGAYCTITFSNGSKKDIPLGYRYRGGMLTKLGLNYDIGLGQDKYDVYYRGSVPSWKTRQVEWDTWHLCNVYQQYVGRPVLEHVIEYNKVGVQTRDDYYCVCQFHGGTSAPKYQLGYPALDESEAFDTFGWVTICPAGYWGPGAKGEVTGTYYSCRKCPTTANGIILSENFGEYPATYKKTVDAKYTACGDDGYYVTGACVDCPENSDECPTYIDENTQSFTCASGYIKEAKFCVACPHNAVSCAKGYIECTSGGSGTSGYYSVVSSDGVASCVPCPSRAMSCDGRRFYCTGGYYYNQPETGTGNCEACPSTGYHYCDNDGLTCQLGFYKGVSGLGYTCNRCPRGENNASGMSVSVATSINQCYISGTVYSEGSTGYLNGTIGTSIGVMICDTNAYYEQ